MIFTQNSISERRLFALQLTTDQTESLQSLWADENNNPEPAGEGDGEEDDGGQNEDDNEEESGEGVEFVDAGALLEEDDY